jgi:hypothetical protein
MLESTLSVLFMDTPNYLEKDDYKMNEKTLALTKAKSHLMQAWLEVYKISKGEMEGEMYELRMAINTLEMKCSYAIDDTQEDDEI